MAAKKPGRFLAPVALVVVALAIGLVVHARLQSHHAAAVPPPVHQASVPNHTHTAAAAKPRFYVIKPGDSLSTISVKTRVSIAKLEALNPSVNPSALQSGQRLRLGP